MKKAAFICVHNSCRKGGASIDAGTVARYKYILRRGQIVGYYSGFTFANQAQYNSFNKIAVCGKNIKWRYE